MTANQPLLNDETIGELIYPNKVCEKEIIHVNGIWYSIVYTSIYTKEEYKALIESNESNIPYCPLNAAILRYYPDDKKWFCVWNAEDYITEDPNIPKMIPYKGKLINVITNKEAALVLMGFPETPGGKGYYEDVLAVHIGKEITLIDKMRGWVGKIYQENNKLVYEATDTKFVFFLDNNNFREEKFSRSEMTTDADVVAKFRLAYYV